MLKNNSSMFLFIMQLYVEIRPGLNENKEDNKLKFSKYTSEEYEK